MTSILLKIMSVALLSLVLDAMTKILAMLAATSGGAATGANEIAQLQVLFGGMALFGFCAFLAIQLPAWRPRSPMALQGMAMPHGAGWGRVAARLVECPIQRIP